MKRLLLGMLFASVLFMTVNPGAVSANTACSFGFCDDCDAESAAVYDYWKIATGSECAGLRESAEYCRAKCPTCKFCSLRIQTYKGVCL